MDKPGYADTDIPLRRWEWSSYYVDATTVCPNMTTGSLKLQEHIIEHGHS